MNILDCTVCSPDYVQDTVYWPQFPVPSLIVEVPTNISLNFYQYYGTSIYYGFNAITVLPELSIWAMLLAGLAIVILKCFRR